MRIKTTAKKISELENDNTPKEANEDKKQANHSANENQCDSNDEVEVVVECRRDKEGNQVLLDGTLVIEPAPVEDNTNIFNSNTEEISFDDLMKQLGDVETLSKETKLPSLENGAKKFKFSSLSPLISVKCTACNKKFNPFVSDSLRKHPLLEVILCSDCIENQKEHYFVIDKDDNKETLCRWCVEGGSLICCDFCPKSYCKTCIKRNLGRTVLSEILNQDDSVQWKCFCCDQTPIKALQDECRKIFKDALEYKQKQQTKRHIKKSLSKNDQSPLVSRKRCFNKISTTPLQNIVSPVISTPTTATITATSTPKVAIVAVSPVEPKNTNLNLLNNMSVFGTDWYLRNIHIKNILTDIDNIDAPNVLHAINGTKKCIEAFYSDIRNIEVELSKVSSASEIDTIVSLFKSVYRHHIFNRFCQIKSRIDEDRQSHLQVPVMNNVKTVKAVNTINLNTTQNVASIISGITISDVKSTANISIKEKEHKDHHHHHHSPKTSTTTTNCQNGATGNTTFVDSIDLTDEVERNDDVVDSSNESAVQHVLAQTTVDNQNEIVDLCNDDEPVSSPMNEVNNHDNPS